MKNTLCCSLLLALTVFATGSPASAADEHELKAAFLFNFAKFVEWPAAALQKTDDSLNLCVLGMDRFDEILQRKDRFEEVLQRTVEGKTAAGRPILVRRIRGLVSAEQCHILFVRAAETPPLSEILAALEGRAVLTVGEMAGFAERGGMINFGIQAGKMHLEINAGAGKRAGLKISSKLLRLATVI